jgi:hypothetical protein
MDDESSTQAQRLPALHRRRDLKMAGDAHAYVRGSTQKSYEWLATSEGRSLRRDRASPKQEPARPAQSWLLFGTEAILFRRRLTQQEFFGRGLSGRPSARYTEGAKRRLLRLRFDFQQDHV